jgi:flagellar biosynthetic protein FliQ
MTQALAMQFGQETLTLTLMLIAPPLGFALVVGLVVSLFQAVTQINEATLAFVPKMVAVFASLAIFGPWMLNALLTYANGLYAYLPVLVR